MERYEGALQIPLIGPTFNYVNVCVFVNNRQLALNLQTDDCIAHDQPYFLEIESAKALVDDLIKGIKEIEGGENV